MTPRVVTVSDLKHVTGELRLPAGTVITPAAHDFAASSGITFRFDCSERLSDSKPTMAVDSAKVMASRIDHTLLHPASTESDIAALCNEASEHEFKAVCVSPTVVASARKFLGNSTVGICAVVGFPSGTHATSIKVVEAAHCVEAGASEIDMVANSSWLKDSRFRDYVADISAVRQRIGDGITLKVIIEAALLTDEQIVQAAALSARAGADYIKTSTGVFSQARIADIPLIRAAIPDNVKIKAAGGIRTAADAKSFLEAGADRLGTSNSIAILWEIAGRPSK